MNSAVVAVGSNIRPKKNVAFAEKELAQISILVKKSSFFFTKPLLYEKQDDFYNGVFFIQTVYEQNELKKKLQLIEQKSGRVRTKNKNGPRTIDLDIVLFNHQIVDKEVFTRDFIKLPIIEILPELETLINSINYRNNFTNIQKLINTIIETLPEKPSAILSESEWFYNVENDRKLIDIIILTCKNRQNFKDKILNRLKILEIDKIADSKISINLITIDKLEILPKKMLVLYGSFGSEF